MHRHIRWLTLLLLLAPVGCAPEPAAPVRIGLLVWPPYETFFLAQDLGYYDDVDVQLIDYHTPAEVLRAYENGVVDAAAMTTDFLMQVASRGSGHRAVLVIDVSLGGDALIAQPEFTDVASLRGKRVGLEMSTLGQLMLARALESGGVAVDEIDARYIDIPDHREAFEKGEIDAVVTYDPVRTELLAGDGVRLFDSSQIPGQIVDVLFVKSEILTSRERTLRRVVDGYFRALDYLREEPNDAANRVAAREGLSPEDYLAALDWVELPDRAENQRWLAADAPRLVTNFESILPVMIANRKTSADTDLGSLIDGRLVANSE